MHLLFLRLQSFNLLCLHFLCISHQVCSIHLFCISSIPHSTANIVKMPSFWKENYFGNRYSNYTWGAKDANEEEKVVSGVPVDQKHSCHT
ncbi:hypothetical protein Hanom_Chr04g00357821 [Helianthus anomalus]